MTDEAGTPLPFIPNSLRSKSPVRLSNGVANEQPMWNYMDKVQSTHDAYVKAMAKHAQEVAKLEIKL